MEKHVLILATTNDFLLKFEQDNVALLQAMGYTVHYAANLREPAYLSDRERIRARGVVPHHIDIARSPYLLGDNRRALRQVLCLLRRWEMGAIHCHTPVGGLVGRLAGRLAPTRPVVVYTAHGFHFYRGAPLYNQLAFYPVEWNLARYTDILVTINSEDYRAARRLPLRRGGKVFQLPGVGLDRREFSPLPPAERAILRQRLGGFDPLTGTSAGGHKVHLTIDAELNAAALEALNGRKGAVAVYNYRTGDVLCMVSSPTFDPADPPEIRDGDSRYDGVYLNRVLSSTFAPGSIFKLVTTAAALEQLDGTLDRHFTCTGRLELEGGTITCPYAHGEMDLYDALARSCNCAYAQLAVELGGDTLAQYAEKAGLTQGFSVSGISAAAGQFTVGQGADLGWSGVGQYDDLVNPCAFLRFLGSLAGGKTVGPRLVYQETTMHRRSPAGGRRAVAEGPL